MKKVLIALGGNALGQGPQDQARLTEESARPVVDLIEEGHQVVLSHGNGPQVGMISAAFEEASSINKKVSSMPFPESGAMSQGYIGYQLQRALRNELVSRGLDKTVVSLVTQVLVDENDSAFDNPTKPIGAFYSKEEADELAKTRGYTMMEDAGRGYRRMVPSPQPLDIVEKDAISSLVNAGHLVIALGGGGIPSLMKEDRLQGLAAVIDKDQASQLLAHQLDCDVLFILTAVDQVAINFGSPQQENLSSMSVDQAKVYIDQGQFAPGSMLPKIQAALAFVQAKEGRTSIISSLDQAKEALAGRAGTRIHR